MPLKSYKICSKIFEHGNDPPSLLNDVQKNCGFGNGGHPLIDQQLDKTWLMISWKLSNFLNDMSEYYIFIIWEEEMKIL